MEKERMLKWFEYKHLPEHLQEVSRPFGELAEHLCEILIPSAERTVALRKLLEGKDAAVRAKLESVTKMDTEVRPSTHPENFFPS